MNLELNLTQPKAFQLSSGILRSSVSDPELVDVVVPKSDILDKVILQGKRAGTTTVFLFGSDGSVLGIKCVVRQNALEKPDPIVGKTNFALGLQECDEPTMTRSYQLAKVEFAVMRTTKPQLPVTKPLKDLKGPRTHEWSYIPVPLGTYGILTLPKEQKLLEKFTATNISNSAQLCLTEHQSRLFALPRRIVQTQESDAAAVIAVLLTGTDVALLAKKPGYSTIAFKLDNGDSITVRVTVSSVDLGSKNSIGRPDESDKEGSTSDSIIKGANAKTLKIEECPVGMPIELEQGQPVFFKEKNKLVTVFFDSDPVADLVAADDSFYLIGTKVGRSRLFLRDNLGRMFGFDLVVRPMTNSRESAFKIPNSRPEVPLKDRELYIAAAKQRRGWREPVLEYWIGEKKYIFHVPTSVP